MLLKLPSSTEIRINRGPGSDDLHILRRSSRGSLGKGWKVAPVVADAILLIMAMVNGFVEQVKIEGQSVGINLRL